MDPKKRPQRKKLKMDSKKKKQKRSKSETVDASVFLTKKKKQKMSKPRQVITSPSLSKMELREAMKKQNDAALVLTGEIIADKASNFIFSPASLNAAVTMMTAGPEDERDAVYSELAKVVFADCSSSGGPKISAINGIWVEQSLPVDHSLKDRLENVFKATYAQVDFRSKAEKVRMELNKWASDHTNGLINDILPGGSVSSNTLQVFGNALYFKGAWTEPFDKSYTKDNEFHILNGEPVRVPFMRSYKSQYIEAYDGFKVLRLQYRQSRDNHNNSQFSMYFYLPDKKDGLSDLVKEMTSTPGFLDDHIPKRKVEVGDVRVPKFKFSYAFNTSELVPLTLYHKACVEIDEEGAEAAAVTLVCIGGYPSPKRIDFVADHPFLFLIREDNTGTILFAGQIYNPK